MTIELDRMLEAVAGTIVHHAEELTGLDQAIGDGDHGANMKRGFEAVLAARDEIAALSPGPALQKIGMTLVMKVGGASGPLYGSFFMAMGKALPDDCGLEDIAAALQAGIDGIKKRGKADAGEKTMLDVWVPVSEALRTALQEQAAGAAIRQRVLDTAAAALQSTKPMLATKGRASYLGERSIGHLDPGARSSQLMIAAVCECIEV